MIPAGSALFTDFYELTMAQAYLSEGLADAWATFSLYIRELPPTRNYAIACGIEDALTHLENLHFTASDIDYLRSHHAFSEDLLACLRRLRFEGDVYAVPEGTAVFPGEPILEVEAPIIQGQIVETYLMNTVTAQTTLASKAARMVTAAAGRPLFDFGLRRGHGGEGGVRAARAQYIAGIDATSNVLAGKLYGVPVSGTMAHSYVQAHDSERDAFCAFLKSYPEAILLVDTYDSIAGVRRVTELARQLGDDFRARGIRLDSGDHDALSRQARQILDDAGLAHMTIVASGGLDETAMERLLAAGAPIDGFGVGSALSAVTDAPTLDTAYKLTEMKGAGRMKLSAGKRTLPGRKQVIRRRERGIAAEDVLARAGEPLPGEPQIEQVMSEGERVCQRHGHIAAARERCRRQIETLPAHIRALAPADPPYPISISPALLQLSGQIAATLR